MNRHILFLIVLIIVIASSFSTQTARAELVVATVGVGTNPYGMAFDSSNSNIYVTNNAGNSVSVINGATNTVIATIPVGTGPRNTAFDSANGYIYVANQNGNTVSVINGATNTVIDTILGMNSPYGIAYDSSNGYIYVSNYGNDTVSVINGATNTVTGSPISVGHFPTGLAFDSSNSNIYVANNDGTVSVINTLGVVIATIPVGTNPTWAEFDSSNGYIYVSNNGGDSVSVINGATNTVITTIPGFHAPSGMGFDPANGYIYVANLGLGSNNISVINGVTNTIVGSPISVGAGPQGVVYDSANSCIYVANFGDNTVSVIQVTTTTTPTTSHSENPTASLVKPSFGGVGSMIFHDGLTINGKIFDLNNYNVNVPKNIIQIGQTVTITIKQQAFFGPTYWQHVALEMNFGGKDFETFNANMVLIDDKTDGSKFTDPDGYISDFSVKTTTDSKYTYTTFQFTAAKQMPDTNILVTAWDQYKRVNNVRVHGAIAIVDPNAPVPVQERSDNQYNDYVTLQNILDKDGYDIPLLLNKLHSLSTYSSIDINWVYDKGVDKLTMVESDKSGNVLGEIVAKLYKKIPQPTVTAHDYANIPEQLNREDPAQEEAAMLEEAQKAEKILESMHVIHIDPIPNVTLDAAANSILENYRVGKSLHIYVYEPVGADTKKIEKIQAAKFIQDAIDNR